MPKIIKKENREKIMELIRKGASEEYETSWDEKGTPYKHKKKTEIKKGKKARAGGARFELRVRDDLESQGWIVDKWTNNLDEVSKKIIKAKRKYNPFNKMLIVGTGFPDFIAFKPSGKNYEIIGVEVKTNGTLSKIEKEKCVIYLNKNIFGKILIAKKGEKRGKIVYEDFMKKYGKKYNNP